MSRALRDRQRRNSKAYWIVADNRGNETRFDDGGHARKFARTVGDAAEDNGVGIEMNIYEIRRGKRDLVGVISRKRRRK